MRTALLTLLFLASAVVMVIGNSYADTDYVFDCQDSSITGVINYSVIGQYRSNFKECSGTVTYDKDQRKIKSVTLTIQTKSIHSNCEWCDDIVRSQRLLDTQRYPTIVYTASAFDNNGTELLASGDLDLHGIGQKLRSSFSFEEHGEDGLVAQGKWVLRRKDFGITWNKLLDHGGVLVGDHITVDWHIKAKADGVQK